MQRIVFIAAIFIASALAQNTQGNCPAYACLKTGDSCAAPCGNCLTDLQTCFTANAANQTGVCACLNVAIGCISGRADATICQISIKSTAMMLPQNCSTLAGANCTACGIIAAYPNPPAIPTSIVCNLNTDYCNANKVCATKVAPGGACMGAPLVGECATVAGTTYSCKAGTCQRVSMSMANDLCTVNADCYGKMNCTAGVCQGFPNGTACTRNEECNPGLFCSAGFCAPYLATGAACTKGVVEACGLAGTCGNNGTCVLPYSAPTGAPCYPFAYPPMECTFGSYCNAMTGNCTLAPPTPACFNNTDCAVSGVGSVCQCTVGKTGNGVCSATVVANANLAACTAQAATLLTCTMTNMCRYNPAADSFTCIGTKCKNEWNAYNTCINKPGIDVCAVPTSAATGATSAGMGSSGTKPNSAAAMTVGVAVLALSASML